MKKILLSAALSLPLFLNAGAFDSEKGLDKITLKGKVVCLGCSLKKLSGANAQCGLYTQHDAGIKLADGSLWTIVNNAKGHDVIRAHSAVIGKNANLTGWLYPNANHIEIDTITVDGISKEDIAKAAHKEDIKIAKALINRKVGESPVFEKDSHSGH